MKTFLKWLILTPITVLIVTFAIVNRHAVPVSFDPFGSDLPGLRFEVPLFIVMFACAMLGVVAGSLVTWLRQGRNRRALREARSDLAHIRDEAERARRLASLPAPLSSRLP
jgi:uncharacterized integral membrane protein